MKKAVPLLVVLLAAILGAFFLLRPGAAKAPRPDDSLDEGHAPERAAPTSLAAPPPGTPKAHDPTRIIDEAPGEPVVPTEGPAITGVVVDAETGKPIAGASIAAETAAEPCPRALARPHPFLYGEAGTIKGSDGRLYTSRGRPLGSTDKDGAFRIGWDEPGSADVFVKAAGHVMGCACRATTSAPVTIRLDRGLSIEGIVVSRDAKPIAGARVWTTGSSTTASGLGHDEVATSNAEGRFAISGLVTGSVIVRADLSPNWMPTASEPMEPGRRDVKLVLVPAFIVTFELKTDDGHDPETPTVAWTTTGNPPRTGLQMLSLAGPSLQALNPGPQPTTWTPIRIPADRPTVRFEVKALGYSTWASEFIEIPQEGGKTSVPVELKRDPNLGRLIVHLEDRDGKVLSYVNEKVEPAIWRRDGQAVSAGIVLKPAETLELPALPSGPYGLLFRSPGHAPAMLEKVDVAAGRDTEVRAILGLPAKVRVKFTAPERLIVKFRLTQGREVAMPFPETGLAAPVSPDDAKNSQSDGSLDAGPEGVVLTGLATGRYTIEVMSPELTATPTAVDLVEGDTKEVEISVSKK